MKRRRSVHKSAAGDAVASAADDHGDTMRELVAAKHPRSPSIAPSPGGHAEPSDAQPAPAGPAPAVACESHRDVRLKHELAELSYKNWAVNGVKAESASPLHWTGTIRGPIRSPYEGGTFCVGVRIPDEYPFKPPVLRFITRVWHPNVMSHTGDVRLDSEGHTPAMTIKHYLLYLQALLSKPDAANPFDTKVARMYHTDLEGLMASSPCFDLYLHTGITTCTVLQISLSVIEAPGRTRHGLGLTSTHVLRMR